MLKLYPGLCLCCPCDRIEWMTNWDLKMSFLSNTMEEKINVSCLICADNCLLIYGQSFAEVEKSRARQRFMETCGLKLEPINVMGLHIFILEVVISVMTPWINSSKTHWINGQNQNFEAFDWILEYGPLPLVCTFCKQYSFLFVFLCLFNKATVNF